MRLSRCCSGSFRSSQAARKLNPAISSPAVVVGYLSPDERKPFSIASTNKRRALKVASVRLTTELHFLALAGESGQRVIDVASYNPFAVDPGENAIGQRGIGLLCPDLFRKRTHEVYAFVWTTFFRKGEFAASEDNALLRRNGHQQVASYFLGELIPNIRKQQAARFKMLIGQYSLAKHQVLYADFRQ